MPRFSRLITLSLASAALLSACSRPTALFQASKPVQFHAQQLPISLSEAMPVDSPARNSADQSITSASAPVEQAGPALVNLTTPPATDERVSRRLEHARKQLTGNRPVPTVPVATKKTTFVQRIVLKTMARKMQRQLAPNHPKEITGTARLGLIIAGIGLLLLLIGNGFGSILGLIALLAGGALFVYALLQE